ncbi:conserved hypothetical protein [Verticillium alfalfae VaMs.102]|uniref:C6 zinc finger domain-containing protein n=1 Tax=Verticillium alfalfae (strain VaMs.102 / ATCC MYA-4576 / FGSC 10136) TaxID=526221 RepID=C9SIL1_VERA1|nr:conserved hypothetical protein [Verticillium alfalfae VaMs.102]EEY18784.1 conserved hypothetical protein [Verticillium alfalfae VaMs.102]
MKIRQITTCHTCRARKLASGRECAGYQHDLIFRPPTVSTHHQAPIISAKRRRNPPTGDPKNKRQPSRPPKAEPGTKEKAEGSRAAELIPRQRSETVHPPLTWPLLDIISLVIQNFSPIEHLPKNGCASYTSKSSSHRVCGAWVEALPELARDGQAELYLSPAIKTLAVSIVSRGKNGRAPVSDALEAQTIALSSIQSGLGQMMASNSNLLAAATMCLFLSEFIHVFMSRQKSFLAETQWLHAPFSESGAAPLQNLFSEMINMPVTVGIVEKLESMPLEQAQFAAEDALHNFETWVRQLVSLREAQGDGGQYQYFPTEPPYDNRTALQFSSITAANYFTHIWAFHIVCAQNIRQIRRIFPCLAVDVDPDLETLLSKEAVIELAILILRSIQFLARAEFKLFGAASAVLPLNQAGEVLKREGADSADLWYWYHEMAQLARTTGYNIMARDMLEYHHGI